MSTILQLGYVVNNRYQIQQITHQALFERIYLVTDETQAGENLILKEFVSRETSKAEMAAQRFQRDLAILQQLKHSQIQQVKDWFWTGEQVFIVQSYVEGQSYQDLLQVRSPLTELEATTLLKQILPVLSYLHHQQITHQDISPRNLLLRSYDNLPILVNFGITADILTHMGGETIHSKLLNRVKRLAYNISLSHIGEDLYALAVTIVMLLTGQEIEVLFNPQTQTWDWENWKLVSDQFAAVINRMLSAQAMNQFESADAVLQALNSPLPPTVMPSPPQISPLPPLQSPLNSSPSPQIDSSLQNYPTTPGLKDWQKAVIIGSVIGLSAVGGMWFFFRNQSSQISERSPIPESTITNSLPSSPIPEPTVTNPPPLTPAPEPTITNSPLQLPILSTSISQPAAVTLVNTWLQAKQEMFAPPYNRQIAAEITTGQLYNSTVGSGGSIDWLQSNNAYYKFGVQRIENLERFVANANQATIQVRVTEERTLYKNGRIDPNESDFKTRRVIYNLELVNGQWKIASLKILK